MRSLIITVKGWQRQAATIPSAFGTLRARHNHLSRNWKVSHLVHSTIPHELIYWHCIHRFIGNVEKAFCCFEDGEKKTSFFMTNHMWNMYACMSCIRLPVLLIRIHRMVCYGLCFICRGIARWSIHSIIPREFIDTLGHRQYSKIILLFCIIFFIF